MFDFARYLAEAFHAPFSFFLVDAATKATLLLAAAMVASALLRRSSAAVRHRVWCLTFAALLALPLLSMAVPKCRVAVLPYNSPLAYSRPLAPREESLLLAPQARADEAVNFATARAQPSAAGQGGFPLVEREDYYTIARHANEPAADSAGWPLPKMAVLWLSGVLLSLLPLAIGCLRTYLLRRRAGSIDDESWCNLLNELSRRLSLTRRVQLFETEAALMPMTWGVLRPVVMLPRQARDWPDRLRRIVLLHELAHIKRYDVGFQVLGRVVCAFYWFHPLAWYALRRLRIEREFACDDCVVLAGERASDYAAELLQIARSYRPVYLAAAVALAQRNNLEHRLGALFDRARSHLPLSTRAAGLLLVGVATLVTITAAVRLAPQASADDVAQRPPAVAASDEDVVTISGMVVDPQGKPFAGAKVSALHEWHRFATYPPLAKGTCDSAGHFTISFRKSDYATGFDPSDNWKDAMIVASADAFGLAWIRWREIALDHDLRLQLVNDLPIMGRVVDLEGRPIAGVEVKAGMLRTPKDSNLDRWLKAVRRGESNFTTESQLAGPGLYVDSWSPRPTITDRDGRFRIAGLGRERVVELSFHGPTIAYSEAKLVTRSMKPTKENRGASGRDSVPVYGAETEVIASPAQPIEGIVRDAEQGTPLAGVRVESLSFAGQGWTRPRLLGTTTDASGHYRLSGMPKGMGNEIMAVPNDNQPYLMRKIQVPEQHGPEPVVADFELHRGIWISGRVKDKATQKGVVAQMYYWPLRSNKMARMLPEFSVPYGFTERYATRPDGTYRLVGLPGKGIVGAKSRSNRYRLGAGAEMIAGADERGNLNTFDCPQSPSERWPHAVKEVDPPPGTESFVCDLALDPGGTITVSVVDPDGRPLMGFEADGKSATWHGFGAVIQASSFEVVELGPDETRTVVIRHKPRKLASAVNVRLADHPTRAMTAALTPAAKIAGRVVDQTGAPVPAATLELHWFGPDGGSNGNLGAAATDEHGRFEYTDVPTGCMYNVQTHVRGDDRIYIDVVKRVSPGETKNLGDIKVSGVVQPNAKRVQLPAAQVAETADQVAVADAAETKSGVVTLRGRVLLPDGKPAVGAGLYWVQFKAPPPRKPEDMVFEKRAAADDEGRFEFSLTAHDAPLEKTPKPLIAHLPGYGVDWLDVVQDQVPQEAVLRLVADNPIRGRVLDTEGRHLAGAEVSVRILAASQSGSLDGFLSDWKQQPRNARMGLERQCYAVRLLPLFTTITDREGRFELTGVGVERLASVNIAAPGQVSEDLEIVNRPDFDAAPYNKAAKEGLPPPMRMSARFAGLTGPVFEHVAETELVVRGTVFAGADRKAVVGAIVGAQGRGINNPISMQTDEQGRFELRGVPRGPDSALSVHGPRESNLLFQSVKLDLRPGQTVIDIEVEMKDGCLVEGRVFDQATGRGVKSSLQFVPLAGNKYAELPGFGARNARLFQQTDDDGRFRLLVMPGPGVLMAQMQPARPQRLGQQGGDLQPNPYRQASFSEEDGKRVTVITDDEDRHFTDAYNVIHFLRSENVVKVIDLIADGKSISCDLPLDSGKTATIKIEDEQSQPVADAIVSGAADAGIRVFASAEPTRTIYGLGPDRPRHVYILQAERHLAGSVVLTGDEPGPVTVRLGAAASISGSALDPGGEPLVDAVVQVVYRRRSAFELLGRTNPNQTRLKTDAAGHFRVENVLPGERLAISFSQGDKFFGGPRITDKKRQLKPGEKLDLGEFKARRLQ